MIFAPQSRRYPARRRAFPIAILAAVALTLVPTAASAIFLINQPWVLPAGKTHTTRAFMKLTSTDGATVVSADSEAARRVTIHSARSASSVRLALPAGREIVLAPGGDHLTLTGLSRNLRLGDRVEIKLMVRDDNGAMREIRVSAEVRERSPLDDELRGHHHH